MVDPQLFLTPDDDAGPVADDVREQLGLVGYVVEFRAIAKLLELGHKVARPVVDDDGVDLVVDYRLRVQVKATRGRSRKGYLRVLHRPDLKRPLPDVLLVFDRNREAFYVLPEVAMGAGRWMVLPPKYEAYREAWHVFRDLALEFAA